MRTDRFTLVSIALAIAVLLAAGGYLAFRRLSADPAGAAGADAGEDGAAVATASGGPPVVADPSALTFQRLADPPRTAARDAAGRTAAVFTDGARTVRLTGAVRTFREPKYTSATVSTDAWVRLAPQEWKAGEEKAAWVLPWLTAALADTSPDALAIATQYLVGMPEQKDNKGVRFAGDAGFGPFSETDPDGRAENSDFFDYLGVKYAFPDGGRSTPQPDRFGDLDCSGFLRMVYGYRLGYPVRSANTAGVGLPRRAFAMAQFGPGAVVIENRNSTVREHARLQPGDLLFFNLDPSDGPQADHSGIYLGLDDAGHHRFVSSRSKANGPTLGDYGGASILDGSGRLAQTFRSARRL
jgi:cell wall-associated NlpC family hydrolase